MNKPFEKYETYPIIWQNIQIEIRYLNLSLNFNMLTLVG